MVFCALKVSWLPSCTFRFTKCPFCTEKNRSALLDHVFSCQSFKYMSHTGAMPFPSKPCGKSHSSCSQISVSSLKNSPQMAVSMQPSENWSPAAFSFTFFRVCTACSRVCFWRFFLLYRYNHTLSVSLSPQHPSTSASGKGTRRETVAASVFLSPRFSINYRALGNEEV